MCSTISTVMPPTARTVRRGTSIRYGSSAGMRTGDAEVAAHEHDPRFRWRRPELDADVLAAPVSEPLDGDGPLNRSL